MLKIKDEVDLKLLVDNYGFIDYEVLKFIYKPKATENDVVEVSIDKKTKIINIQGLNDMFHTKEDTLYDLIADNLVEMLEDGQMKLF